GDAQLEVKVGSIETAEIFAQSHYQAAGVSLGDIDATAVTDSSGLQGLIDGATAGDRIFFRTEPQDIPAIFAQETVAVARSAFIEDDVKTVSNNVWSNIADGNMNWLEKINGYNLSYLREGASNTLLSDDEYASPLVSWWRRGAGKTMAISFPITGDFSQSVRDWPDYGNFLQTIGRWAAASPVPAGLGLKHKLKGNTLNLELFFNKGWDKKFALKTPQIFIESSLDNKVRSSAWRRLNPGRFATRIDLQQGERIRGVVMVGDKSLSFGPLQAGTDAEWSFDKTQVEAVKNLSKNSGGQERLDLSTSWQRMNKILAQDISNWFLCTAAILLLLEFFLTHTGMSLFKKNTNSEDLTEEITFFDFEENKTAPVLSKVEDTPQEVIGEQISGNGAEQRRSRYDRAKLKK
ncbi:MAG: hypothetical protein HRT88_17525, partial [Lentisphaeraceae bacterium]|nr:hypothetical protein [Lentisphaeraceae bacterium]